RSRPPAPPPRRGRPRGRGDHRHRPPRRGSRRQRTQIRNRIADEQAGIFQHFQVESWGRPASTSLPAPAPGGSRSAHSVQSFREKHEQISCKISPRNKSYWHRAGAQPERRGGAVTVTFLLAGEGTALRVARSPAE